MSLARTAGRSSGVAAARGASFRIELNGTGTIEVYRFRSQADEYVAIYFTSVAPGTLVVRLNGVEELRQSPSYREVWAGSRLRNVAEMLPVHLFVPADVDVEIRFIATWSGWISGGVRIEPARRKALEVARAMFGLDSGFTSSDLKSAYRKLVMEHHPDRGGDVEKMKAVNFFRDLLEEDLAMRDPAA